jgi:hypothetical protein
MVILSWSGASGAASGAARPGPASVGAGPMEKRLIEKEDRRCG